MMIETPNRPMDFCSLDFCPTSKSRVRHETLSMRAVSSLVWFCSCPVITVRISGACTCCSRCCCHGLAKVGRSFFSFLFSHALGRFGFVRLSHIPDNIPAG